jgi:hypothetical protein
MKPLKRKKLKEDKDVPEGTTEFTRGDKTTEYLKSRVPGKVLKTKYKKGKKPKGKYISEEKAERQIKRKRRRVAKDEYGGRHYRLRKKAKKLEDKAMNFPGEKQVSEKRSDKLMTKAQTKRQKARDIRAKKS